MSQQNSENVLLETWVEEHKTGTFGKRWKPRYLVLLPELLLVFSKKVRHRVNEQEARHAIELDDDISVEYVSKSDVKKGRDFMLRVSKNELEDNTPTTELIFAFPTEDDCVDWATAIEDWCQLAAYAKEHSWILDSSGKMYDENGVLQDEAEVEDDNSEEVEEDDTEEGRQRKQQTQMQSQNHHRKEAAHNRPIDESQRGGSSRSNFSEIEDYNDDPQTGDEESHFEDNFDTFTEQIRDSDDSVEDKQQTIKSDMSPHSHNLYDHSILQEQKLNNSSAGNSGSVRKHIGGDNYVETNGSSRTTYSERGLARARKWEQRYVILRTKTVEIFQTRSAYLSKQNPMRRLSLNHRISVEKPSTEYVKPPRHYVFCLNAFELVSNGKRSNASESVLELILSCKDGRQFDEWYDALKCEEDKFVSSHDTGIQDVGYQQGEASGVAIAPEERVGAGFGYSLVPTKPSCRSFEQNKTLAVSGTFTLSHSLVGPSSPFNAMGSSGIEHPPSRATQVNDPRFTGMPSEGSNHVDTALNENGIQRLELSNGANQNGSTDWSTIQQPSRRTRRKSRAETIRKVHRESKAEPVNRRRKSRSNAIRRSVGLLSPEDIAAELQFSDDTIGNKTYRYSGPLSGDYQYWHHTMPPHNNVHDSVHSPEATRATDGFSSNFADNLNFVKYSSQEKLPPPPPGLDFGQNKTAVEPNSVYAMDTDDAQDLYPVSNNW